MPWIIAAALIVAAGVSLALWNKKRGAGVRLTGRALSRWSLLRGRRPRPSFKEAVSAFIEKREPDFHKW